MPGPALAPIPLHAVVGPAARLGPAELVGDGATLVSGTAHDSRAVIAGSLFFCVPGAHRDGHDHAAAAVRAGAAALVCSRPLDFGVPEVRVGAVRPVMGPVAALVAGDPSHHLQVLGITGTNGKTTVVGLLGSVLTAAGWPVVTVGTLTGVRTTPEAPELQSTLAEARAGGARAVAMEVSSHALDLHRVDGTRFQVAVFTNLSRDHLDHHGDLARYFAAKARLFTPELSARAVVGTDDPYGRLLLDAAELPTVGYSLDDAADLALTADGSTFTWRGASVTIGLAGGFNVLNALAAATAAGELGVDPDTIAKGLAMAGPVPGRFERVDAGQPFLVAVDYAHTPDGLEQLLAAGRELAPGGRVIVVFGAGGDRDRDKRPMMGEVADRLADVVVLTTDNPRTEDPDTIISEVQKGMEGCTDLVIEPDRASAIGFAVASARPGDVVLLAGKGHETTQVLADRTIAFDDREVAHNALRALGQAS